MTYLLKRCGIHTLNFFFIFTWLFFYSCQEKSGSQLQMEDNSAFMAIVAFQDSIVHANTPGINTIDQAYLYYLDSVCPLILENGDFSLSGINAEIREKLFESLQENELAEIFQVGDSLEYFSMDVKRRVKKYFPYYVTMNMKGQFAGLLKSLSDTDPFMNKYYSSMLESGDISPACFGMVLRDYNQLDFSNPSNRLLLTVTILSVNETIKDRFVH